MMYNSANKPSHAQDNTIATTYTVMDGEWIEVINHTFASPVCCEVDGVAISPMVDSGPTLGSQTEQCSQDGYIAQSVNGCKCDDFLDTYEWSSPALDPIFDPNTTCRLLGNRRVVLIGDSTMEQAAITLINSLVPGGGCHHQLSYHSADTLVRRDFGAMNRGKHFTDIVHELKPDIAIVTVGAHIAHNYSLYMSIVGEVIHDMEEIKRLWGNNITFGWKTQQPGGCLPNIAYPKNPSMVASTYLNNDSATHLSYNHGQFYQWDEMLITRLEEIKMPYLDLRMLYSRMDGHISSRGKMVKYFGRKEEYVDCLHMCTPGPLDVVARLFYRFLLEVG